MSNELLSEEAKKEINRMVSEGQRRILVTCYPDNGVAISEIDEFCEVLQEMKRTAISDYPNEDVAVMIFSVEEFKRIQEEMKKI